MVARTFLNVTLRYLSCYVSILAVHNVTARLK